MRMTRREAVAGGASLAGAMLAGPLKAAGPGDAARRAYANATVIDALGGLSSFDPDDKPGQTLLPRFIGEMRASGVTAINLTVSDVGNGPGKFLSTVENIAFCDRQIALFSDVLMKVTSAAGLREAKASGKVGVIYGTQDTTLLEGDLARLDTLYNFGVRIIQPVYNRRNMMGDGCLEPNNGGLSLSGRELVAKLNAMRVLVDMSHAAPRTQAEAIALSTRPCAITHSGCRALNDNPRNTFDGEMRALAGKGGVMGIYFMPFLRASGQQTAADVIAHIEHAVKVMGEDHVGLGTDSGVPAVRDMAAYRKDVDEATERRKMAGIAAPGEAAGVTLIVPEYNHPRRFERLADDLLKRGHSSARVAKILGNNFARLFSEVWG
ncbi:MAG: membrane dipeptidase [Sphingomicrobium sp.]